MRWHPAVHCFNSPQPGSWGKIKVMSCKGRWFVAPHVWFHFSGNHPLPTALYLNAAFVFVQNDWGSRMWSDHGASQKCLEFLSLTIETHCLPSSIFIEHLQCTRHNRTYRRHCPCSWGAYILRKNTPLVEWHFCLVFSEKYWGNTRWGVSFGYDLAPSLLERRRKDFKRETVTDHSGQGLQGDKHKLGWGAGLQDRRGRLWDASRGRKRVP